MQSREIRHAKKASDLSNRSDAGKKCQTHEDRCNYYDRFLKPLAIGAILLTAEMGGAEARLEPLGSALQRKGYDNTTDLPPAFNQQEFNNLSHPTALEFNPYTYKVTPELLDHLRKVGVQDPEQLIQNVQKRDHPQSIQKREQRRDQKQQLAENAQKALDGVNNLFEEMPGKESKETSQPTTEIHQRKQDKGKELIKLDEQHIASLRARKEEVKANRKVLEHVSKLLAERRLLREHESSVPRRELYDYGYASIVFVHGFKPGPDYLPSKGSSSGFDCYTDYWGDAIEFLREQGLTDFRTIKYYTGDTNCANGLETSYSSDLHDDLYKNNCINYPAGYDSSADGTNDESIYHLSCLFAQYLHYNFGQSSGDFSHPILVGHSMGGIIIRETMYQVQEHAGQPPFSNPVDIGFVGIAITFNTPHGGVPLTDSWIACLGCTQAGQLYTGSDFMSELSQSGPYPLPTGGFTHWAVIGSECDAVVSQTSAINMSAAESAIVYSDDQSSTTCYDHGGALHDTSKTQDAHLYYCFTNDPFNHPCGTDYNTGCNWQYSQDGPHGLLEMYLEMGGTRTPTTPTCSSPNPSTDSTTCLSVANSYMESCIGKASGISGHELRVKEYPLVLNNCPMTSYSTGFTVIRDADCPSGTSLYTKGHNPLPFRTVVSANPSDVPAGKVMPSAEYPLPEVTYQCRNAKGSYVPLLVGDSISATGYASRGKEGIFSSSTVYKTISGENPDIEECSAAESTKALGRARTALLWNVAAGIAVTFAHHLRWRD